jgi:signal peptidase I
MILPRSTPIPSSDELGSLGQRFGIRQRFNVRQRRRLANVACVFLSLAAIRQWVVEPVRVSSVSMSPSIEPDDSLVIDKLTYKFRSPSIGDIVTFQKPNSNETMLKRVVATAGDSIAIENGVLIRNGKPVRESFTNQSNMAGYFFGPVKVGTNAIFLLGDNRSNSEDSRRFGAIPTERVEGRVLFTFP